MPSKPALVVGFLNKIAALILTVRCEILLFGNVLTARLFKVRQLTDLFLWHSPKPSLAASTNKHVKFS